MHSPSPPPPLLREALPALAWEGRQRADAAILTTAPLQLRVPRGLGHAVHRISSSKPMPPKAPIVWAPPNAPGRCSTEEWKGVRARGAPPTGPGGMRRQGYHRPL